MAERRVSLSTFVDGGLLNNADVECTEFEFVSTDLNGNASEEFTALRIVMMKLDDADGKEHEQFLSVGGDGDFQPSKDHAYLVAAGERSVLNSNSNFALFMQSMEKLGVPKEKYDEDISSLNGCKVHIMRVPDPRHMEGGRGPKRGSREVEGDAKQDRPKEILVVSNILEMPWDKKGGKGGKKTTTKKTEKPKTSKASKATEDDGDEDEAGDDDANAAAIALITKLVVKNGGEMDLDELGVQVFQTAPKAMRKDITALIQDDDFWESVEGISVSDNVVSMD